MILILFAADTVCIATHTNVCACPMSFFVCSASSYSEMDFKKRKKEKKIKIEKNRSGLQ